jgi:hypothetical protein
MKDLKDDSFEVFKTTCAAYYRKNTEYLDGGRVLKRSLAEIPRGRVWNSLSGLGSVLMFDPKNETFSVETGVRVNRSTTPATEVSIWSEICRVPGCANYLQGPGLQHTKCQRHSAYSRFVVMKIVDSNHDSEFPFMITMLQLGSIAQTLDSKAKIEEELNGQVRKLSVPVAARADSTQSYRNKDWDSYLLERGPDILPVLTDYQIFTGRDCYFEARRVFPELRGSNSKSTSQSQFLKPVQNFTRIFKPGFR